MTESDQRSGYKYFADITTRWMDNDIYGHVNNVVYYSYFDSVANQYLIEQGGAGYLQRRDYRFCSGFQL